MYKSMFRMTARRPIRAAQLAEQDAFMNPPARLRMYAKLPAPAPLQVANPTSGVYRALSPSDKTYLADRVNHMRNVYWHFAEQPSSVLNPDQIGFLAVMAATGLLGDDGDAGTRHARKFGQAVEYASAWLASHHQNRQQLGQTEDIFNAQPCICTMH